MTQQFFTGDREYFPTVGSIPYEGRDSDNPLAFKFYERDRLVGEKTMEQHLPSCPDGAIFIYAGAYLLDVEPAQRERQAHEEYQGCPHQPPRAVPWFRV